MRILEVNALFPPEWWGGAEVYVYNLARQLLACGHQVWVIAGRSSRSVAHIERTYFDGLPVVRMPSLQNPWACHDERIEQAFAALLDEFRPELVHLHNYAGCLPTSLINLVKDAGLPVFQHLHDHWLMCPAGTLMPSPPKLCSGPDEGRRCATCPATLPARNKLRQQADDEAFYRLLGRHLPTRPKMLLPCGARRALKAGWAQLSMVAPGRRSARDMATGYQARNAALLASLQRCDRLLSPTRFVCQSYQAWGLDETRIQLFPHGLDLSRFAGFQRLEGPGVRFGYLGAVSEHKGVHVLVQAFRRLPLPAATLNIWGAGPPAYRERLAALADGDHRIHLRGPLQNPAIARALAEIDVLVVPSLWAENCPMVVHEAFAAGAPVIANKVGGLPEMVEHGVSGLLVEPGNVSELAERMEWLGNDPHLLQSLRRNLPPVRSIAEDVVHLERLFQGAVRGGRC